MTSWVQHFQRFVNRCICWDTSSGNTGPWQLPKVSVPLNCGSLINSNVIFTLLGMFGHHCDEICLCENGAHCNHISGSCTCRPGWIGQYCNITCPSGTYGDACSQNCSCMNEGVCDARTGSCWCKPGWTDDDCSLLCSENTYGHGCNYICQCENESPCHHVTGTDINTLIIITILYA